MQHATAVTHAPAGKWMIAATVVLASFVSVMDISIVNVAMPRMISTFGESLDTITWVGHNNFPNRRRMHWMETAVPLSN